MYIVVSRGNLMFLCKQNDRTLERYNISTLLVIFTNCRFLTSYSITRNRKVYDIVMC
jgi:hypothetical protein